MIKHNLEKIGSAVSKHKWLKLVPHSQLEIWWKIPQNWGCFNPLEDPLFECVIDAWDGRHLKRCWWFWGGALKLLFGEIPTKPSSCPTFTSREFLSALNQLLVNFWIPLVHLVIVVGKSATTAQLLLLVLLVLVGFVTQLNHQKIRNCERLMFYFDDDACSSRKELRRDPSTSIEFLLCWMLWPVTWCCCWSSSSPSSST